MNERISVIILDKQVSIKKLQRKCLHDMRQKREMRKSIKITAEEEKNNDNTTKIR